MTTSICAVNYRQNSDRVKLLQELCVLHDGIFPSKRFDSHNVANDERRAHIFNYKCENAEMRAHAVSMPQKWNVHALYANFKLDGRREMANKFEMSILVAYRIHKFLSDPFYAFCVSVCVCVSVCKSGGLYEDFSPFIAVFLQILHIQIWTRQSRLAKTTVALSCSFSVCFFCLNLLLWLRTHWKQNNIRIQLHEIEFQCGRSAHKQKHRTARAERMYYLYFLFKDGNIQHKQSHHTFQS